ncbi:MAG: multidrug transporter, partial [Betaproteobacteria bacterium]
MKAGAVLAVALLSGCSMIPSYQRPAAPVPTAWPQPAAAQGQLATELDWRDFFADAQLKRLIEIALQNNRDLRVAVLNIEQARAQYQIRRADELPTLNALAAASRQQPTTTGPGIASVYIAGFSVTAYELDFFGRVRALSQAAQASYLATEEARKTAQISLIAAAANGYLALLADDEQLALTQQTLGTREESLRLTRLKFDNGAASELDVRQAQSLHEAAKATLAQQQRQRALDENALMLLLGAPLPREQAGPATTLVDDGLLADVNAGLS